MPIFSKAGRGIGRNYCFSLPVISSYLLTAFKSLPNKGLSLTATMSSEGGKDLTTNSQSEGLLIKDIVAKLESWAPLHLAGSWDKVGLQYEPSGDDNKVSSIMLTNDLTEAVVDEALAKRGIGMIISYHPPIFQALKTLTNKTWKERVVRNCIENKIAVYSPHTAWDAVSGGINDWLASAFITSSVKPLTISKTWLYTNAKENLLLDLFVTKGSTFKSKIIEYSMEVGANLMPIVKTDDINHSIISIRCDEKSLAAIVEFVKLSESDFGSISMRVSKCEQIPWPGHGEGRLCLLKDPIPLMQIVETVKRHLNLRNVRLATARNASTASLVQSVALCAGSGSSVLKGVEADVFLTGEMGHHDVLEANHRDTHVILCEHSNTERGFIRSLVEGGVLHKLFEGKIEVVMSEKDQEPLLVV